MGLLLKNIFTILKERAFASASAHLEEYLKYENEIIDIVRDFKGIKSEYYCYDHRESRSISKFLAIYSDLTSFFTAPSKNSEYHLHVFKDDNPRNFPRQIDIPVPLIQTSLNKGYPILSSFLYKNDTDTRNIAKQIGPFLDSGQFLLRPIRTLIVNLPEKAQGIDHEIYFANADTPDDHWIAKVVNEENSFTILNGKLAKNSKILFELTLPFFDKASPANLVKLLEDESDLLSGFRAMLKDLTIKIVNGEQTEDLRNDIIQPEVDKINRKFKTITNIHRYTIGSTVSLFTISLLAIQVDTHVNFQTLFNTLIGSSAIGFIASEIRYQQDVDKLKDSSYFLLWKISRLNS